MSKPMMSCSHIVDVGGIVGGALGGAVGGEVGGAVGGAVGVVAISDVNVVRLS